MKLYVRLAPAWAGPWFVLLALGAWLPAASRAEEPATPPVVPTSPAAAPEAASRASAPVVVWGRTLVDYRLPLEFSDVRQRAEATAKRIDDSLGEIDPDTLVIQPVIIGKARGVFLSAGPRFLLSIMEGDIEPDSGATLDAVASRVATELRQLIHDHADQHSLTLLFRAIVQAVIATVAFVAFWTLMHWLKARFVRRVAWLTKDTGSLLRFFGYDWRPVLIGIGTSLTRVCFVALILFGAYGWITFVLGRFPYTRRWGDQLGEYLLTAVSGLASAAVHQIPNLIALVVIYLVTRGLIRVLNGWFSAVESGKYLTVWLDPEAARATRRLADIGVWIVALIVAFPYLPGSHSEAFKGVSVFLGLMLSLGGAGFIGQIIGGLAAVYSRSVRSGDYIVVGDTQGVVKELGLLTTKVVTRTREEVTIPNAMLINSAIRNFSRSGQGATLVSTSVTIGYDAPWRQVEALLIEAAARTEALLKQPAPRVHQTSLDDFYVTYELTGFVRSAQQRAETLTRLHRTIQDLFNEHGVQIMSPHFEGQPAQPVLVPKERWHQPPASGPKPSAP